MIITSVHDIRRATAEEYDFGSVVHLKTSNGDLSVHLPKGTADAVAACINVAVATGQKGFKPREVAL